MKYLTRLILFDVFALWLTSQFISALEVHGGVLMYLFAGLALSILDLIVKPMLKILFIPVNFLTLGLGNWLVNAVILYVLTLFIFDVKVRAWTTPALSWSGFAFPSIHLSYIVTLVVASVTITVISDFLHSISEE